jgi:hypothetical protein
MWRAFFLAIGVYLALLGAQLLAVERVYLIFRDSPPPATGLLESTPSTGPQVQYAPPAWVPWSFLSFGVVLCLYSFTIPRRLQGK